MAANTPKSVLKKSGLDIRDKTDSSLKNERTKVDNSLVEENNIGDATADDKLAKVRADADQAQLQARNTRDNAKKEMRDSPELDIVDERKLDDKSLKIERERVDKAQKLERDNADAVQARERKRLRLAAEALLSVERKATDEDLKEERSQTDRDSRLASDFLSGEVGAHGLTKDFMAIVSHDLRNPLSSIAMATEILLTNLESKEIIAKEAIEMAGIVQRSTAMMERLISDLLDVERIAAGKVEMNLSNHTISELFLECEDIFTLVAGKKSIKFETSIESNEALNGYFDRDRIRQALSNLIGNAIKHTGEGGKINLSAKRLNHALEFSITDTGTGIGEKEQLGIFEKFSQLGRVSRSGLGLGLYITKWIVEAHGGMIKVKSAKGKGSTFTFSIPDQA